MKVCDCGSRLTSWLVYDYRGVAMARVCLECKDTKLSNHKSLLLKNLG